MEQIKGLKERYTKSERTKSETFNEIVFNGLFAIIEASNLHYLLFLLGFLIDNLQIFIMILDFYTNNEPIVKIFQYLRYINLIQLINEKNLTSNSFFALVIFQILFNIICLLLLIVLGILKTQEKNSQCFQCENYK